MEKLEHKHMTRETEIEEVLNEILKEGKPKTGDMFRIFDTGIFAEIVKAYVILACNDTQLNAAIRREILKKMEENEAKYTSSEALRAAVLNIS